MLIYSVLYEKGEGCKPKVKGKLPGGALDGSLSRFPLHKETRCISLDRWMPVQGRITVQH